MSSMKIKEDQRGVVDILLIPLITLLIFFLAVSGFAIWAYMQRSYYKNSSDKEAAIAVEKAVKQTQDEDAAKYAEAAKQPYDRYIGPSAFGNITINYPKTWSSYVIENERGGNPIDGYFQPGFVPNASDPNKTFALRVELVQSSYDTVLAQFQGLLQQNKVSVRPYALPKVPSVVGSRIEGQITPRQQGSMIVLPLRNMTLKIWTESNDFKGDLDTHVLPNLSFIP